ncbi:hypothetical protein BDR22DRAFT_574449 [Usnea florida]
MCDLQGLHDCLVFEECRKNNVPLPTEGHVVRTLEVAHIIPYSVAQSSESTVTASSKAQTFALLKWFNPTIDKLITKDLVDIPINAMTLGLDLHDLFGALEIYFDDKDATIPNQYEVESWNLVPYRGLPPAGEKIILTTQDPKDHGELPSKDLLNFHRSLGRIASYKGGRRECR